MLKQKNNALGASKPSKVMPIRITQWIRVGMIRKVLSSNAHQIGLFDSISIVIPLEFYIDDSVLEKIELTKN